MTAALLLAGWAAVVAGLLPGMLARAAWVRRAPAAGVLAWQALGVSATVALALAVGQAVDPSAHHRERLLHLCGLTAPASGAARAAAALVALWPLVLTLHRLHRAARDRRRHRALLDLAAHRDVLPGALLLDHPHPAVYCLPGRHRRVVVSRGALEALSAEQLAAALAHEQGHLAGRHHLAAGAAEAFAGAFGPLPLGRLIRPETRVLLEMAADDRALRAHSRLALAGAMATVATTRAPAGALAAGHHAAVRIRRLADHRRPPLAALALAAPAAATLSGLPFLLACLPHLV